MKRTILISLLVLVVLAIIGIIVYFAAFRHKEKNILTLYGNVDVRQTDISFRVSGQVKELLFEEGEYVPKGALMAILDTAPYNSQVIQAKNNVASIQANLENAQQLLKRRKDLIGIEGVSQEDLDTARSNLEALQANLASAQAAERVAEDNFEYTRVYAPNDGIILTRIREPGSVVNPTDPVYTLSILSPVWVRAYVSEPDLGRIAYGMHASVFTDTDHGKVYHGKIGFISPVAEFTPKTVETTKLRTDLVYRLRIYVDNPDNLLKQGMPVTVKIKTNE